MKPLPIANESTGSTGPSLPGEVQVFDPPMCCPTGLCGPGVDPALLALARDLRWLEAQGVKVSRHGLTQEPAAFAGNSKVAGLLQAFGEGALPAALVNGSVLVHGRYPNRAELLAALMPGASPDSEPGACAPGSGCC